MIHERIRRAAHRAGRRAEDVTLITVSKTFDAETVRKAVDAGARDLGENRVQEAAGKVTKVRADGLRWHLIGHLQANKARLAVKTFDFIHSIDSRELVERLDRISGEESRRPSVLVQVDLGREPTKTGAREEDLQAIVEAIDGAGNLELCGLMTLPPFSESCEDARPYFIRLRELLETLNRSRTVERRLTHLSMGMTNDFEVAVEEGATMIRIGTAVFGAREKR